MAETKAKCQVDRVHSAFLRPFHEQPISSVLCGSSPFYASNRCESRYTFKPDIVAVQLETLGMCAITDLKRFYGKRKNFLVDKNIPKERKRWRIRHFAES